MKAKRRGGEQPLLEKIQRKFAFLHPTPHPEDTDWLGRKQPSDPDWLGRRPKQSKDWLGRKQGRNK